MKTIKVEDALGKMLCHDITQIVPGEIKGRRFKKGHIIKEEDIPVLLSLGKDNIYIWEPEKGIIHEDDAAFRMANIAAPISNTIDHKGPKEGKITILSKINGLLKVDKEKLISLNMYDEMMMATLHNNTPIKKGSKIAGTRIIPLTIMEENLIQLENEITETFIKVLPYEKKKVGIVTTGNEIFYKRIQDKFGPVIKSKVEAFGSEIIEQVIIDDSSDNIAKAIEKLIEDGANMIICTGGMSVDPDDATPLGIKKTNSEIIAYGAPTLPGAMLLVAYKGDIPILGLPGCVMYAKTTGFDLILPRILAGEKLNKRDIVELGHGGLCLECEVCVYPACSFGKV